MSNAQSRPWTRVHDWVTLLVGVFMGLSPFWFAEDSGAWTMMILGGAIAAMALIALAKPEAFVSEGIIAAAGALAFLAPWVMTYTSDAGAAWISWIGGIVVVVVSLAALPVSREVYRTQHHGA